MEMMIKLDPESINLIVSGIADAIVQVTKKENGKRFYGKKELADIFDIPYSTLKKKPLPYIKERKNKRDRYSLNEVKEYLGR